MIGYLQWTTCSKPPTSYSLLQILQIPDDINYNYIFSSITWIHCLRFARCSVHYGHSSVVFDCCAAAYLGDIALTEDELELIGVTDGVHPQKPPVTPKPPPSPASLLRPRDERREERRRQRTERRRRRRKQWRMSSFDVVDEPRGRVEIGDKLGTAEHRQLNRRGGRSHRLSAEHWLQKRYASACFRPFLS